VSFSTYTIHQLLILKTGSTRNTTSRSWNTMPTMRHTKKTHKEKDNKKKKQGEDPGGKVKQRRRAIESPSKLQQPRANSRQQRSNIVTAITESHNLSSNSLLSRDFSGHPPFKADTSREREREANKQKQGQKRRGRGTKEYEQRKQSRRKEQLEGKQTKRGTKGASSDTPSSSISFPATHVSFCFPSP